MSPAFDPDWHEKMMAEAQSLPCDCPGPHCQRCGCCDENPCEGGCICATPNLCSRCV